MRQNKEDKESCKKIARWSSLFICDGSKQRKRILMLVWVLPILVCLKIFSFSAQSGEESTGVSMPITIQIVNGFSRLFHEELSENEVLVRAEKLEFFVRKAGHMGEYAILAISILLSFVVSLSLSKKRVIYTLVYCLFYAATDEFHQLFVFGRSGRVVDVMIDFIGSILGTILFAFVLKIVHIFLSRHKKLGN